MKRILITGSNGFIGQELLHQALTNSDIELLALSRGDNRFYTNKGYTYISADVCRKSEMSTIIDEFRPDIVIHTVALANVDICEREPDNCKKNNVLPVEILVSLAERYNFHLIHLSTDFIFDGKNGAYKENDIPNPLNEYGKSKLEAEQIIRDSTVKWAIVRTILVYGVPRQKERSSFILWIKNSLENKTPIKIVTDHYRMPTFVKDVVKACLTIAEKEVTGIFHISSEELFSIYEIAQNVVRFWNLDETLLEPILSESLPSSVLRPKCTGFIIDKAKYELDFIPHTLIEGLSEINRSFHPQ